MSHPVSTPQSTAEADVAVLVVGAFVLLANTLHKISAEIKAACDRAERTHRRAARLQAYRLRRQWKKGDRDRLKKIGVSPVALPRFQRLAITGGRGRPIVPIYEPLPQVIAGGLKWIGAFFDPATLPHQRRKLLAESRFWPLVVEAIYRGEYDRARAAGLPSPSALAEDRAGLVCGIGADTVRKVAGRARAVRVREGGKDWLPPITSAEFEDWKRTGRLPTHLEASSSDAGHR